MICVSAHLLESWEFFSCFEMLFVRSIRNHECMAISKWHVVLGILHLAVLRAEIAV